MANELINSIADITSYEKIMGVLGNNPLPLIGIVTFNIALYGPVERL